MRALTDSPNAFRSTLDDERRHPDDWWADLVGDTVDHPRGGLWVAEAGEETLGMLFGRLSLDSRMLSIGAMWVAPHGRRNGAGGGLLAAATEWARSAGAVQAELWVTEDNSAAESLYRAAGFHPTADTQPLRPGSPLTVIRLTAEL